MLTFSERESRMSRRNGHGSQGASPREGERGRRRPSRRAGGRPPRPGADLFAVLGISTSWSLASAARATRSMMGRETNTRLNIKHNEGVNSDSSYRARRILHLCSPRCVEYMRRNRTSRTPAGAIRSSRGVGGRGLSGGDSTLAHDEVSHSCPVVTWATGMQERLVSFPSFRPATLQICRNQNALINESTDGAQCDTDHTVTAQR